MCAVVKKLRIDMQCAFSLDIYLNRYRFMAYVLCYLINEACNNSIQILFSAHENAHIYLMYASDIYSIILQLKK